MGVEIPVRRISVEEAVKDPITKGFILEYIVVDAYTIHTILLTDKDPTLVSTDYVNIASEDFHRAGEVDEESGDIIESSIETFEDFAGRTLVESLDWACAEIIDQKECNKLVAALAAVLPAPVDR